MRNYMRMVVLFVLLYSICEWGFVRIPPYFIVRFASGKAWPIGKLPGKEPTY